MNSNAFVFGIESSIDNSYAISTQEAYERVGHNTGNLAFHFAIGRQLGINRRLGWESTVDQINSAGRIAVIPCANQVGSHIDMGGLANKLEKTIVSHVAIGMGAQAGLDMTPPDVPAGTVRWLKAITERAPSRNAPNISVRGKFSQRVLEDLGFGDSVVALGCPTLFINPDIKLGQRLQSRFKAPGRICVVAGHYRWRHLANLEASLAEIATDSGGAYIMQSPIDMIAIARGDLSMVSDSTLAELRDFCRPGLDVEQFVAWSRRHSQTFFSASAWMEEMRRYDLVIGARIHGVMMALQAGVPGICIAHDSRTLELCQTMRVPHVHAREVIAGFSKANLAEFMEFDGGEFDRNRAELARRYTAFLAANSLEYSSDLLGYEGCV